MDWNSPSTWLLIAGLLVVAELMTGTFYLLLISLGMAAAAGAAYLGMGFTTQLVTAAVVGGGGTALWYLKRANAPAGKPVRENADVNIDIGERVQVDAWGADGTARVPYRGSTWTVRLAPGLAPTPGTYQVSAVEGNWLILSPLQAR